MSNERPKQDEPYLVNCDNCEFDRSYTTRHGALIAMAAHNRTEGEHNAGLSYEGLDADDDERGVPA